MKQGLIIKISTVCVSLGLSLMTTLVDSAWGNTFTFKQNSISGESFWSGSFSGNDLNNNKILEKDELNSFSLILALDLVPFSLTNLSDFEYLLDSTGLIQFYVQGRKDINNKFVSYREYDLSVNGFVPFSRLSVISYFDDTPISIADGASNQSVDVQPIPEPLTLGGVFLASVIGASFKKAFTSSKF